MYGLIGYPLSHSFSSRYFSNKFNSLGLNDHLYTAFPLKDFDREFPALLQEFPNLRGLNVTIPFKERIIPFLDSLSDEAAMIGAVNCIQFKNGRLIGHNTDACGFEESLVPFLKNNKNGKALVLGTGGASRLFTMF
ncbi:MAG: hypothetical protein R2769_08085 [Saprospiraceae bacterium]